MSVARYFFIISCLFFKVNTFLQTFYGNFILFLYCLFCIIFVLFLSYHFSCFMSIVSIEFSSGIFFYLSLCTYSSLMACSFSLLSSHISTSIKSSPIHLMFFHGITISLFCENRFNTLLLPGTMIDVVVA